MWFLLSENRKLIVFIFLVDWNWQWQAAINYIRISSTQDYHQTVNGSWELRKRLFTLSGNCKYTLACVTSIDIFRTSSLMLDPRLLPRNIVVFFLQIRISLSVKEGVLLCHYNTLYFVRFLRRFTSHTNCLRILQYNYIVFANFIDRSCFAL